MTKTIYDVEYNHSKKTWELFVNEQVHGTFATENLAYNELGRLQQARKAGK